MSPGSCLPSSKATRTLPPAKPSTRISTLGQAATTASANRKSEPKRLSQLFHGELDWIVMKALEKDRNRIDFPGCCLLGIEIHGASLPPAPRFCWRPS
jgi:hypothetical protein